MELRARPQAGPCFFVKLVQCIYKRTVRYCSLDIHRVEQTPC